MFKSYPNSKDTPSRPARKASRRGIFVYNKKLTKLRRKVERLARRAARQDEN